MNYFKKASAIIFGNFCVAVATVFFIVPSGFISGGATGVALAAESFFNIPIKTGIAFLSFFLLTLGYIVLGKNFALSTALSAVSYPLFIGICENLYALVDLRTNDLFINITAGALLTGYGVALVMRQGASTGGIDTIAVILSQKSGLTLSFCVALFEILAMLTQIFYSTTEEIAGGIFTALFYTALMNHLISKGIMKTQVFVYSEKYQKINNYITTDMNRGCTLYHICSGYRKKNTFAVQTIISNRELFKLKEAIKNIDPDAFVMVSEISEVGGKGFSFDKNTK